MIYSTSHALARQRKGLLCGSLTLVP